MDSTGKLIRESILDTKAATILEFFGGLRGLLEESATHLLVRFRSAFFRGFWFLAT